MALCSAGFVISRYGENQNGRLKLRTNSLYRIHYSLV